MKTELIVDNPGAKRLILIFAGWNTNPDLYRHISITGWDTMVAYDYDGAMFPNNLLSKYSTVYLFAWSLGISASERFLDSEHITNRIAINGTSSPVSDSTGIPTAIFTATEATLNERNLMKFRRRMAGDSSTFTQLQSLLPATPDIENLRAQLRMFATLENQPRRSVHWNRAYISANDAIFPAENQKRAWNEAGVDEIIELNSPHYVDLERIISSTIPNLEKVGRSFSEASATYNNYAVAQQEIAEKLVELLPDRVESGTLHILEIGPGSGIFTRLYAKKLHPASITFVDLYDIGKMNLASEEEYIVGDAEKFLEQTNRKWDVIVSSSAIQWFVNIPEFLKNAHRCLTEGGILACSTFLPDNLSELRRIKPSTLLYPTEERLTSMLRSVFSNVNYETLNIPIRFENAMEALRHLRATGVGNAHNNTTYHGSPNAINVLKEDPTLHYSAYIFCATD